MILLLSIFIHNILPVFLIVGAGALLGLTVRPDVKALSRTTFYILGPCLIFAGLTRTPLTGAEVQRIAAFAALAQLLTAGLAWLVVRFLRWDRTRQRALLLVVLVVNAGNFGLSVVLFAFGQDAQARAMIYFVVTAVLGNTLGTAIAAGGGSWRVTLAKVVRVPMVYATIVAMIVNAFDRVQVPELLMGPILLVGSAALPMMLLILGLQLACSASGVREHIGTIALATAMRLLAAPLIAFAVAWLTGVEGITRQACILEASTPSGVTSTILSLEYDLAPEIVTSTVFFSTLCSAFTLSVVISVIG